MFLSNLSTSILKICDARELTYESASELCKLSSRYFGDIVRRRVTPSIGTLEKICVGFCVTPNDLLLLSNLQELASYRQPMIVTQVRCYPYYESFTGYPVCPRCGRTIEREYQAYCDRCGQCLDWSMLDQVSLLLPRWYKIIIVGTSIFLLSFFVIY